MGKFFSDFKKFISRGNVVDMAIGVIIASAFTAIVTALANKIIMPLVNWFLVSVSGGQGLESIYTFLKRVEVDDGAGNMVVDLANSIYIDWGAFITAIIDFFLIALILFVILKVAMASQGYLKKAKDAQPTKEEKKQLKEQGVNMKNHKEVLKATAELREKNKEPEPEPKPTQEELLAEILAELKKKSSGKAEKEKAQN